MRTVADEHLVEREQLLAVIERRPGHRPRVEAGAATDDVAHEIGGGVYGGSKAFVLNFSRALHGEGAAQGLRVQAVLPGATRTEIWDRSGRSIETLDPAILMDVHDMVDAALAAQSSLEDTPELHGEVTLTTVGELVRWELAPRLPEFYRAFPHLRLRILAENRVTSLAAGEADVALRMFRPERGGLVARKVLSASYGFFAAASLELHPEMPWLGLTGSLAAIPEQRFTERAFSPRPPRLLVAPSPMSSMPALSSASTTLTSVSTFARTVVVLVSIRRIVGRETPDASASAR